MLKGIEDDNLTNVSVFCFVHTMLFRSHWLLKYLLLCSTEESHTGLEQHEGEKRMTMFPFEELLFKCGKHIISWNISIFTQRMFRTVSSCLMHSIVASRALVPRVASSSTAFTVFSREVTFVTITCKHREVNVSDWLGTLFSALCITA